MANSTASLQERVSGWLGFCEHALETTAEWVETRQLAVVGAFSVCYFMVFIAVAQRKLFWFDELFTYYVSGLPSWNAIVAELRNGVDYHPPSYFLMMRAASSLWPDPHVSFRIPSIVGVWLLSVCLFVFVTRRTSAVYGTLAMLAPSMTGVRVWVTDARPYGPAVGLLALGFLAWQSTAMPARRSGWLVLLAVSIAAAISTSYYAVLALVPLGIAELVKSVERRKIDFSVWLAMLVGASVSLLYLPAVTRGIGQFASDGWARPSLDSLLTMYRDMFESANGFWLACLLFGALLVLLQRPLTKPVDDRDCALPAGDVALGAGLLLLPVLGLVVAYAVTKAITERYVISTITGFSILLGLLAFRVLRASAATGLVIVSAALLSSLSNWYIEWRRAPDRDGDVKAVSALLSRAPADTGSLPVVFESPLTLFQVSHYAGRALTARYVFLADADSSGQYSGVRYTGLGLTSLQRYSPVHVDQYASFRQVHNRFLLYESPFIGGYVLPKLIDEGAKLRLLGRLADATLYLVD